MKVNINCLSARYWQPQQFLMALNPITQYTLSTAKLNFPFGIWNMSAARFGKQKYESMLKFMKTNISFAISLVSYCGTVSFVYPNSGHQSGTVH